MSSDKVNKIANYNQMMSWLTRQEFKVGGPSNVKVDIPGLGEEIEKLFKQGLSNSQVLKKLNEIDEFKDVGMTTLKRIKKERNLEGQKEALLKSQAEKYNALKTLVEQSNDQPEFVQMQTLRSQVGLPPKVQATDLKNLEKFDIPKLDTAADKVTKAFNEIINNPNTPVEEVLDLNKKLANKTGLATTTVSETLQTLPEYQEFKPVADKLSKPLSKANIISSPKIKTLGDVINMTKNRPSSGTFMSTATSPENFIMASIERHINQGGNQIQYLPNKAPGDIDRQGNVVGRRDAVFRYKGQNYSINDIQRSNDKGPFEEIYKTFLQRDELLNRDVIHPITKNKTTFGDLMMEAYGKGTPLYGSQSPYEIDHFSSVKNNPFSNLRIIPGRINRAAGQITASANRAATGVFTKKGQDWTPAKSKQYLEKSGYNFTKDIDQLFKDEVKLADDILVKGRVLRTPQEIGKEAVENKFTKLLNIEGVKKASEIERPEAAKTRDMFKAFNDRISLQKNIPVKEVKQDVSEVSKVLKNITNKMGSGVDPTDIAKYVAAEAKDLAAFGKKYGGDILKDVAEKEQSLLGKIGTGALKTIGALDLPIMQVAFASMQNWEEDSPLWVTLPAAFTDEIASAFNLYNKTGGKAKEFGKFLASSFVPRVARSPLFKAVSKVGKIGSVATPLLELGQEAYKFEKQKRMIPEIAREFGIPIEIARKGFENYIKSTIPQDLAGQGLDETVVPESPGLPRLKRTLQDIGSIFGLSESPYKDPNAKVEPVTPQEPTSTERGFVAEGGRMGFEDGTDPKKPKGLGSLSKRNFLKTLALIPAGIMAIRGGPNLFKKAKPALKAIKGMPDWFSGLVNKVIETGTDVTKQFATKDREVVHVQQLGEAEGVRVTQDLETGQVRVDYDSPTNMGEQSVTFTYKPGYIDEDGSKIGPYFQASEAEPRGVRMGPDDYDIEFDGENLVEDTGELLSDTSSLKQFATGKLDETDLKLRQEKVKKVQAINNDQMEQAEYLETKYGAGDPDAYKQFPDDD